MTVDELMAYLEACPSDWSVELLFPGRGRLAETRDIEGLFADRSLLEDNGRLFLLGGAVFGTIVDLKALRPLPRRAEP